MMDLEAVGEMLRVTYSWWYDRAMDSSWPEIHFWQAVERGLDWRFKRNMR